MKKQTAKLELSKLTINVLKNQTVKGGQVPANDWTIVGCLPTVSGDNIVIEDNVWGF